MTLLPDWETLTLAEQVAQMVVVRASGHLFDHQIEYPDWEPPASLLRHWLHDLGVGGVIVLGGTAAEIALRTQQLQDWAKLPLFIAADIEEGVGQRFAGATWFPPPMAVGAIAAKNLEQAMDYAEAMGAATAAEALAIGINWVLAPVVDVNNNPENPVINIRAWGETADTVAQLTTAFIRGTQRYPVLSTAKHFPGHGDTAVDSHLALPVMPHSRTRLEAIELVPFRAALQAGVDAVMTAHVQIPALDATLPATLSPQIVTQLLRHELGFTGLTVTDALVMGAITQRYGANEAAVLAVEAGVDILLMPVDPEGAIQAVCEAVQTGRIAEVQIQAALERIWQAKQKVGVNLANLTSDTSHAWEQQLPPPIQIEQLAQPKTIAASHTILKASLQYHQPISRQETQAEVARNLILVDDALNCAFLNRQAPAITFPQSLGYRLQVIDSYTPPIRWNTVPQPTLLQVFVRGNPFRSSASLIQRAQDVLEFLLSSQQLQALIVYGSPYAMAQLRNRLPANLPYIFTYGQLPAAQTVALEALLTGMPSSSIAAASPALQEFTD
jgi:beta-glucosidase